MIAKFTHWVENLYGTGELDSNQRPPAYEAGKLTTALSRYGQGSRDWTYPIPRFQTEWLTLSPFPGTLHIGEIFIHDL